MARKVSTMKMSPMIRKAALTLHVVFSVGWLGAAAAYLAVAIKALTSVDSVTMRASYPTLELLGWSLIVPLCGAALLSGLVQSLGTPWGLFRHYWVVAKLALTLAATGVLLGHMPAVRHAADLAAQPASSLADMGMLPTQLVVHAAGGTLVLLAITALSVFKPWGLTPLGRRARLAMTTTNASKG